VSDPSPSTALVSVVVPARNAEAFIDRALESVARGRLRPAEIIVVDDASTDATAERARAAGARVISLPHNAGPSAARNLAVSTAQSPWIAFLDADDWWHEDKLARQWAALSRWPDAGYCFTDYDVVRDDGVLAVRNEMGSEPAYRAIVRTDAADGAVRFDRQSFLRGLVKKMFIRQSSVIVRRELFERCGGYNDRLRLGEDYDLFLRLAAYAPAVGIEAPLVRYVRHANALSADAVAEVASIDALWEMIASRPERYPIDVRRLVREQRATTLCEGTIRALRFGRHADAVTFGRKALRVERSPRTIGAYALACGARTPLGGGAAAVARTIWRRRPRRAHIAT
jgi:glycosyltransferase involved in cell wall biosynthesis